MSLFSDNIRYLRAQNGITQEKLAEELMITRARYVKYEAGTSEAPYEILRRIAHHYHISVDLLLSVDIRRIDMNGLIKLDDNRILLPIAVDKGGENIIEIIPHKAKAGYLTGYSDPEFIESLQHISLPMLKVGKFRAFEIEGDSMPPYESGTYIIGKYIENINELKLDRSYLIMTYNGMTYKRLVSVDSQSILLQSDNESYDSFSVPLSEILQLWEFAGYFGMRELGNEEFRSQNTKDLLIEFRNEFRNYVRLYNTNRKDIN